MTRPIETKAQRAARMLQRKIVESAPPASATGSGKRLELTRGHDRKDQLGEQMLANRGQFFAGSVDRDRLDLSAQRMTSNRYVRPTM